MSKRKRLADTVETSESPEFYFGGESNNTTSNHLLDLLLDSKLDEFKSLTPLFVLKNDKDDEGNSFLHRVVLRCSKDDYVKEQRFMELVKRECPELMCTMNMEGDTPLMMACRSPVCPELIMSLAEASPRSTLQLDCTSGHIPLLIFLRNVKVGDKNGEISLEKCVQIIHLLCQNENSANYRCVMGKNSLCYLFSRHDFPSNVIDIIAEILLKNGAKLVLANQRHAFSYLKLITFKLLELVMKYCPEEISLQDMNKWSLVRYVVASLGKVHNQFVDINIEYDEKNLIKPLQMLIKNPLDQLQVLKLLSTAVHVKCEYKVIQYLLKNTSHFHLPQDNWVLGYRLISQYATSAENVSEILSYADNWSQILETRLEILNNAAVARSKGAILKLLEAGADPLCAVTSYNTSSAFITFIASDEALDILNFVLDVPKLKNNENLNLTKKFYLTLINLILANVKNEEITKKKLEIILNHIKCTNINMEVNNEFSNPIFGLESKIPLDIISCKLCTYNFKTNYNNSFRNIKLLIQAGFMSINISTSPTPLTIFLLSVRNPKREYMNSVVLPIVDLLLENGVNINSMALTNSQDNYKLFLREEKEALILFKIKKDLNIPDALFLSLWYFRSIDLVQRFLVHWWGPPVALTAILPNFKNFRYTKRNEYYNRELLPFFIQFGHIPYGTSLIPKSIRKAMNIWKQGRRTDIKTVQIMKKRCPLSLQDLCKYKVRHILSSNVSYPDVTLTDLMDQVLPFDLPPVFYNKL